MKKLMTVWCEHGEEGAHWMAWIGHAEDPEQARNTFTKYFGDFYAQFCEIADGVVHNDVTTQLFPAETLDRILSMVRIVPMMDIDLHAKLSCDVH